jgi:hypothetical protein
MSFLWGRNELLFQRIQLFWKWVDLVCNTKGRPAKTPCECLLAVIKRRSFLLNLGSDKNHTRTIQPANLYRQNFLEIKSLAWLRIGARIERRVAAKTKRPHSRKKEIRNPRLQDYILSNW